MFRHNEEIREADWVLFPEYWQINSLTYGLRKPIFPNPASYRLGHDKVEMTRALWVLCPQYVPRPVILAATRNCVVEVLDAFDFPFIVKEVRNSMGTASN